MKLKIVLAAFASALVASSSASAAPLLLGSGWQNFSFDGVGSSIMDNATSDTTYTFTLTKAATLKVTDLYLDGDQFNIVINGVGADTSVPANDGAYQTDPDAAFADARFSHGTFNLAAGEYTVSGTVIASPYGSGGAAIELSSAVPEPATWAMMVMGFGMVGFGLRYRRKSVAASLA